MAKPVAGAEFSRANSRVPPNDLLRVSQGTGGSLPINLGNNQNTLENGTIIPVSDFDAFRPGQQIYFYFTIYNGQMPVVPGAPWISRVRLKPWWLRTSDDFRAPGGPVQTPSTLFPVPTWTGNDQLQFGGGMAANNRAGWFPHPKMIDVSEWQSVNPPPAAPPRHSDSIIVDEVFVWDLQDPNSAPYQATLLPAVPPPVPPATTPPASPAQTLLGRSSVFQLISHGWALGLTHQFDVTGLAEVVPNLLIDVTWQVGTL